MGPQTELIITFSAAFCTSGSGNASPSARPSRTLKNTANMTTHYSYIKIHMSKARNAVNRQQNMGMDKVMVNNI